MQNILLEYVSNSPGREIAILTVSRPKQLNALNLETMAEINEALSEVGGKKSVRALIITGSGEKAFVAGADIKQLEGLDADGARKLSEEGNKVFSAPAALPIPVIAAVNGFALGGGCELALACDIRLASENASFSLPEVALGVCPGWGGTQRLARLVGTGNAAELMFSARRIKAPRALEIGLVNSIHPPDKLMDAAMALANEIAENAPIAIAAVKRAMYGGLNVDLQAGLEMEACEFSKLFQTTDAKNGLSAFINKEKYEYTGR